MIDTFSTGFFEMLLSLPCGRRGRTPPSPPRRRMHLPFSPADLKTPRQVPAPRCNSSTRLVFVVRVRRKHHVLMDSAFRPRLAEGT